MTSCWTFFSILSTREGSTLALDRIAGSADRGISPLRAQASQTAVSTLIHVAYLFRSVQMEPMACRVYRGIMKLNSNKNSHHDHDEDRARACGRMRASWNPSRCAWLQGTSKSSSVRRTWWVRG